MSAARKCRFCGRADGELVSYTADGLRIRAGQVQRVRIVEHSACLDAYTAADAAADAERLDLLRQSQEALPGSGEPPLIGPQWLVSVSASTVRGQPERRPTPAEVERVVEAFAMPAYDEDNHHPGVARHLWCPIAERYRSACECKLTEVTIVEGDGYAWTSEAGACRGCEYHRMFGRPCPHHPGRGRWESLPPAPSP